MHPDFLPNPGGDRRSMLSIHGTYVHRVGQLTLRRIYRYCQYYGDTTGRFDYTDLGAGWGRGRRAPLSAQAPSVSTMSCQPDFS
jgi:hypothetical protein